MNKKALIIISLAVAVAAGVGVYSSAFDNIVTRDKDFSSLASVAAEDIDSADTPAVNADDTDLTSQGDSVSSSADDTEQAAFTDQIEDGPDYVDEVVSHSFVIRRAVDHTTGDEYSPRVVFGPDYAACYVQFDSTGSFELYIDTASGVSSLGQYQLYDDIISVEYDDGTGSEYQIISDDDGDIDYIIVNYGDYDVYFG